MEILAMILGVVAAVEALLVIGAWLELQHVEDELDRLWRIYPEQRPYWHQRVTPRRRA